ncbi:hypothetical protein ACE7GA_23615 [Roseomonas sp. CCTCC AB2023176]|uniref:hypothetical protein n=1 Tax=Roseomonas sp. CCTCC AB2023176 TaxID=3342640 RepID=UPI0035DC0FEF
MSVRRGAPKQGYSTTASLRDALRAAPPIAASTTGQSSEAFPAVMDRLGIAEQVRPHLRPVSSGPTAGFIVGGGAELAVQLIAVRGAELAEPFPPELQRYVVPEGGLAARAAKAAGVRTAPAYLGSAEAGATMREKGPEPG